MSLLSFLDLVSGKQRFLLVAQFERWRRDRARYVAGSTSFNFIPIIEPKDSGKMIPVNCHRPPPFLAAIRLSEASSSPVTFLG
jgi:hypothetical protein